MAKSTAKQVVLDFENPESVQAFYGWMVEFGMQENFLEFCAGKDTPTWPDTVVPAKPSDSVSHYHFNFLRE